MSAFAADHGDEGLRLLIGKARSGIESLARRKRLVVALTLLIAVAVRLLAVAYANPEHIVLTWDLAGYDAAAQRLVAKGTYAYPLIVYDSPAVAGYWKMLDFDTFRAPAIDREGLALFMAAEPNAHVLPGYPAFLAAIYRVTGTGAKRLLAVAILQALLSAFTVVIVYRIASRVGEKTAMAAMVFSALYVPSVLIVSSILTETVYALLLCLLVLGALRMAERKTLLSAVLLGTVFGASLWVRPTVLPCALALLGVLAFTFHGQALRRFLLLALVALLTGAAVLSPWWVRNATLYGRWVPFATYASHPFLMGYYADHGLQTQALTLIAPPEKPRNDYELGMHWNRLAAGARREMLRLPVESVRLRAWRVVSSLVRPDGFDLQWNWQYALLVLAQVVTLCTFVFGLVSAVRVRELKVLAIASVPLAVVALQAAVIPLTRYYVPVAPLALIVVAYGLLRLFGLPDLVPEAELVSPRVDV